MNMWQLLVAGGWTMVPLLICSILSLAVMIEKMIVLRIKKVIPEGLLEGLKYNPININSLLSSCSQFPSPFSSIIEFVINNRYVPKPVNQENTQMEGKIQANRMERGLIALEVVTTVAPMLGFLGTVIGLVDVFHAIVKSGIGQTSAFAGGIAKALITTVVGLVIAIPSLIIYRYFTNKVENLVLIMEKEASILINKIYPHTNHD